MTDRCRDVCTRRRRDARSRSSCSASDRIPARRARNRRSCERCVRRRGDNRTRARCAAAHRRAASRDARRPGGRAPSARAGGADSSPVAAAPMPHPACARTAGPCRAKGRLVRRASRPSAERMRLSCHVIHRVLSAACRAALAAAGRIPHRAVRHPPLLLRPLGPLRVGPAGAALSIARGRRAAGDRPGRRPRSGPARLRARAAGGACWRQLSATACRRWSHRLRSLLCGGSGALAVS